ncbi:Uncharacterized protein FKW44_004660 [Caligus rogercresseyi]|uniref:Uncharacterized protein n=1 Tax=Caligus rogercresseyi TaxID=217165 RepID=A0A7T8HM88_CALRO|nr:Uncharacterized protein FKW44_004660 [Caligus rogercresseyi]
MVDIELHWRVLLFSWYKRAKLVDFPWKKMYLKSCGGNLLNPPQASPWKELSPSKEVLNTYWLTLGASGPIEENPLIKVAVSSKLRKDLGLERINDVLVLEDTTHPGFIFSRSLSDGISSPRRTFLH